MKEVSKKEFWDFITSQKIDLITKVVGEFPYTTHFTRRYSSETEAKIVDSYSENGRYPTIKKYYLK